MSEFDPLEKLTLLAAHAIDWRHIPSDFRRWKPEDIAARLAKLHRGASLLARVKVLGQFELYRDLVHWLKVDVHDNLIPAGKIQPVHELLVETAIREVLDPKICKDCRGHGYVPEVGKDGQLTGGGTVCTKCKDGRTHWTEYARAQACQMHHEVFRRHHQRLYLEILTIPWTWEGQVRDALKY